MAYLGDLSVLGRTPFAAPWGVAMTVAVVGRKDIVAIGVYYGDFFSGWSAYSMRSQHCAGLEGKPMAFLVLSWQV